MKRLTVVWCVLLCAACAAHAQQGGGQKEKYVVVPPEHGLFAVALQPDCPVKFEDVRILANVEGGGGPAFRLRNRGTKPIRTLSYRWMTTEYTGAGGGWAGMTASEVVMPGQLVPLGEGNYEIVPLTEELRDKLHLRGPMIGVAILMITKVTFADGTVYDATPTYKALCAYLAKLAGAEYHEEDDSGDSDPPPAKKP